MFFERNISEENLNHVQFAGSVFFLVSNDPAELQNVFSDLNNSPELIGYNNFDVCRL